MSARLDDEFAAVLAMYSTEELAEMFMVSRSTVCRWRTGKSKPHPIARQRIVDALVKLGAQK